MEKKLSFEASMGRLEQIVRSLEQGNVPLEESLKLFEEGTNLVRQCGKQLDEAELKVKQVMTASDGTPVLEDFDHEL